MKLKLSDETKELIKALQCNGDYSEIARRLTVGKPELLDTMKGTVRYACLNGIGKAPVVEAITNYFNEKKTLQPK